MGSQSGPASHAALRRLWGQWTDIVELYARQLPRGGRVNARNYRALHEQLVTTCRALAAANANGRRSFYEDLCYLAEPWLTPWVLQQTDREILLDLFLRCQQARAKLGARVVPSLGRVLLVVAGLSVLAALVAVLFVYGQPRWGELLDWLDDHRRVLALSAKRLTAVDWTLMTGGILIVLAMIIVFRTGWRR